MPDNIIDDEVGAAKLGDAEKVSDPSMVNYREDGGIPGYNCAACQYFIQGHCKIIDQNVAPEDLCDAFTEALVNGRKGSMAAQTELKVRNTVEMPFYIYRVSHDKANDVRRWYATASGVKKDLYQERMTVQLFNDFIQRIDVGDEIPEPFKSKAWEGGKPYLGVAHYLDLGGVGIVGRTEDVYVDGSILKMRGVFEDTDMAKRAFDAIKNDIDNDVAQNERVRVSIAFIDWGHEHEGHGAFERKSLVDRCPYCEQGIGEKIYKKGQLVHLALTRRPAYPDTEIVLEERSMDVKNAGRYEDAESIVGKDYADKLEKADQKLTNRSAPEVAPDAVVIRDDETEDKRSPLDGAKSLDEADAYLERSGTDLIDSWGVLADVLGNISPRHNAEIREVISDFQSRLDVMALRTIMELNAKLGGTDMPELEKKHVEEKAEEAKPETEKEVEAEVVEKSAHPLDEAIMSLKSAYNEALASPGDRQTQLSMIQPAINGLAEAIMRSVDGEGKPEATGDSTADIADVVRSAIRDEVAPLRAKVEALSARVEQKEAAPPVRRAIQPTGPINPAVQQEERPSNLKSIVRRSVGLFG